MDTPVYFFVSEWQDSPRTIPSDTILFAVGDIHGRLDLLVKMQQAIKQLMVQSESLVKTIVYLGDYIDRGRDSLAVLQQLAQGLGQSDISEHHLLGNHDYGLLQTIQMIEPDSDFLQIWFEYGGRATLERLGTPWREGCTRKLAEFRAFQKQLIAALGSKVIRFLEQLTYYHQIGEYLFVHAGIDPNIPFEQQDFADFLLIREPFLSWPDPWPYPFCVVHGHTPARPTVLAHRIGVDTGAFYTSALTAAQFDRHRVRFLMVSTYSDAHRFPSLPANRWLNTYGSPQLLNP